MGPGGELGADERSPFSPCSPSPAEEPAARRLRGVSTGGWGRPSTGLGSGVAAWVEAAQRGSVPVSVSKAARVGKGKGREGRQGVVSILRPFPKANVARLCLAL